MIREMIVQRTSNNPATFSLSKNALKRLVNFADIIQITAIKILFLTFLHRNRCNKKSSSKLLIIRGSRHIMQDRHFFNTIHAHQKKSRKLITIADKKCKSPIKTFLVLIPNKNRYQLTEILYKKSCKEKNILVLNNMGNY